MITQSPPLRPIGTMVDFEETKDGQTVIYHYQVVAHALGLDDKPTEQLQLRSTSTRAAKVGPTLAK